MVHDEQPKYLLAPKVSALLHSSRICAVRCRWPHWRNTGARINEALALTWGIFRLRPSYPFAQLVTPEAADRKAAKTAGRTPAGQQTHRLVPLFDSWVRQPAPADDGGNTENPHGTALNKRTEAGQRKARIWEVTTERSGSRTGKRVAAAAADGGDARSSVPVTPHTFCHSYAMHMLYAGIYH